MAEVVVVGMRDSGRTRGGGYIWEYLVESSGKRNTSHAVMVKAGGEGWGCVLLPLQSTKEQMHTIKKLVIGRHK